MSDLIDLRRLFKNWPYDPDNDARILRGEDGREILQVRTPLGIEQFEMEGRPDGARPHGMESALEFHLRRLEEAKLARREAHFELSARECAELFNEGMLYYFRYARMFQLKEWARTVRDTGRNLRAFDFVHRYARREEDQQFLERWRPYILRVNASAAAMLEVEKQAHNKALRIVNDAIEKLQSLEKLEDETFKFEQDRSLTALQELASQIQVNRPRSELEALEEQLQRAVQEQEFEEAAQLRDRIRELRQHPVC
jgi:UvrB/uvrC motif